MSFGKRKIDECKDKLRTYGSSFDIFADFDHFQYISYNNINSFRLITEKPSFVSQDVWDLSFLNKDQFHHQRIILNANPYIFFCEIDDIKIGYVNIHERSMIYMIAFKGDIRSYYRWDAPITEMRPMSDITSGALNSEGLVYLLNEAATVYGEENVDLYINGLEANYSPLIYPDGNDFYAAILIDHGPFWITSENGIKLKIKGGLSAVLLKRDGTLFGTTFCFANRLLEEFFATKGYVHSHVKNTRKPYQLRKICQGSGSPIRNAISSYISEPNEDTAFNLFLNYNNLIMQESETGTPYMYTRDLFPGASASESTMPLNELASLIVTKKIPIHVDITSNYVRVSIEEEDIADWISENVDQQSSSVYYHRKARQSYTLEPQIRLIQNTNKYCPIVMNGRTLSIEVIENDANSYDFSNLNPDFWSETSYLPPRRSEINSFCAKVRSELKALLIQSSTLKPYNYEISYPEELVGVKKITRGSSIENIFAAATAD